MIYVLIGMSIVLADLMLKKYVEANMSATGDREILGGRLRIRKVHNKGLALGLMKDKPELVKKLGMLVGIFLLIRLVFAIFRKKDVAGKLGLAMIIGGAVSNLFDRFHQGHVTDYINIRTKFRPLKKIYFNLADFFIVLGGIVAIFSKKK